MNRTRVILALTALLALVAAAATRDSRQALLNSAVLAGGAVAIAVPLGAFLALVFTRLNVLLPRAALAVLGLLLFLPLYVHLCGWDAALGKLGWFTLLEGSLAEPFLSGMRGAILVHALAAVPWAALIVGIGLMQVDPAQEEAALLCGPPRTVLWRVTLPQIRPFVAAACLWTAMLTTSEMTVTNIYLINPDEWTLTERFYMRLASHEFPAAISAAMPSVVALVLVIAVALSLVSQLAERKTVNLNTRPLIFSTGRWRLGLSVAAWLTLLLLAGVPIASLIAKAGFVVRLDGAVRVKSWSAAVCLREVTSAPIRFRAELLGTAAVAALAASVALVVAAVLAWRARRGGSRAWPAIMLTALGLAIPGPLIGAALIQIFNHDLPPYLPLTGDASKSWLLLLYDHTPLAPVIAQAIRALPLAILMLWRSFTTLDDDVLSAAALDGCSPARVFWHIAVPQRWPAMLAAWIAALAVAAGDLAWAHLVTPPGLDLLSRRVFGLVHSGVEEQVAAIALLNIVVYFLLALAAMCLIKSSFRNLRGPLRPLR